MTLEQNVTTLAEGASGNARSMLIGRRFFRDGCVKARSGQGLYTKVIRSIT